MDVTQVGESVAVPDRHAQPPGGDGRDAWFRALVQHTNDIIAVLGADMLVRYISPASERVLGIAPEDLTGASGARIVHPGDLAAVQEAVARWAAVPGPHAPITVRLRHADGSWRQVETAAVNLLDDPLVDGIVLNMRDCTEQWLAEQGRLAAERALQSRERLFRAMVQESSDVTMVLDEHVTVLYVSPSVERHLGLAPDKLLGVNGLVLVHPDDRDWVMEDFARKITEPHVTVPVEFRVRAADGTWRVAEAVGTNLLDDPEIGGIVVTFRDVTERHDAQQALKASEERYRKVVERSPIAIAVHCDGRVAYANPAAVRLMGGRTAEDLIGLDVLELVDPSWRAAAAGRMASALDGHDQAAMEYRLRRLDGAELDVEIAAIPAQHDGRPAVQVVMHDITGRKRAEAELAHQATHDPLTGLPNRTLLFDRLEQALRRAVRRPDSIAVLFIDLDRFKVVNDSLGHDRGDELLIAVAERLRECLRPGDTVARFGGDEFVVLCEGLSEDDDALAVARRLRQSFVRPVDAGGQEIYASASIGVAVARENTTARELLRDADAAMYDAKDRGGSRFEVFDAEMRARVLRQLELEQSLRRAVEADELRVVYQPEIDLRTGRIIGAEALVRWEHPTLGLLSPDQFLAVAEETGLVVPLGRTVLRQACRAAARWRADGLGGSDPWVGVNMSAQELTQPDTVEFISEVLAQTGLPPGCLCLEITERTVMGDPDGAGRAIAAIKALGVTFALDDFGTGYSSLEHLIRFPLDFVKVDRSFTDGVGDGGHDTAIVTAIAGMATALGIGVIAEGVETRGQLADLRRLGVPYAQGHLVAAPMPDADLRRLLVRDPRW
jgi:diguanylate cyclase (GGDEF)-like protein/PAS domain S-box-containing protein